MIVKTIAFDKTHVSVIFKKIWSIRRKRDIICPVKSCTRSR